MGKRCYIILCTCLLVLNNLSAQSAQQADEEFAQKEYTKAKATYSLLLRKSPQNTLYLYRYARCAYELGEQEEAILSFEAAGERYALRNFYLGELYFATYRFEEAVVAYQKYADVIGENHERYPYVERKITQAQKGIRYLKRVDDIVITDSVTVRKDEFLNAYHLSKESGSISTNEQGIVYTNERGDRQLKVYEQDEHKNLLSCQRLLEGTYICDTLPAPINDVYNENYPFMLSDGITLYFASDSPDGLGGYDIYVTRYNSGNESYLTPENIGMPFNSPANDYMLAIDESRHIGYFATDRNTPDTLVTIYTFIPNDEKRIIRNQSEEYIRLAAQLKVARKDTTETATIIPNNPLSQSASNNTTNEFRFVIDDATIYTRLNDFQSADARALYEQVQLLESQLTQCKEQTDLLRLQYGNADENKQKELRNILLQLETDYLKIRKQLPKLLNQIRELEQHVSN